MFYHQQTNLLKVDLHCNLPHFRNVSNTSAFLSFLVAEYLVIYIILFLANEVGYGPKENNMVKLEAKSASEEAVSRLMKQKQDMEASLKDLEEEIVDLAGKVKPKIQFCKKIPSS